MRSSKSRFQALLAGHSDEVPLIDIGSTSLTGIRATAVPHLQNRAVAHPIFETLALEATECIRLGSDFIRTGLLFEPPTVEDKQMTDAFGVEWLWHQGSFSPLNHPLEHAKLADIPRHPRPQWKHPVQSVAPDLADNYIVIADAPCPGLLDMCFILRNTWQFMNDITDNWRTASALLEWSLATIVQAYEHLLQSLPRQPDVIIYGDDLGYKGGMFLSPLDFRNFVRPRLKTLLSKLRQLTSAAICFHSCGAIYHILPDIADLGVEMINVDTNAKGMATGEVRQKLPTTMVLHGSNDLQALGTALENNDRAGVALLTSELVKSTPVVAGPLDNLSSLEEVTAVLRAITFIRNLSAEDFKILQKLGPVHSILKKATEKTLTQKLPGLTPSLSTV